MGYELRRQLREALGPDITGLQRAVALEITDDANDATRESYAGLDDLARWTGAKDPGVIRNALKRLSAAGWEFRIPIGKGKDGRLLYAVPGRRMTFRVPLFEGVAVAPPMPEGGAGAPSEGAGAPPRESGGSPFEPQGGAGAPSEGAVAPSQGAGAPPFSSSPHSPQVVEAATTGRPVDLEAFGAFWLVYPKSRDKAKTLEAWTAAVAAGVDPAHITAAAQAYAREKANEEPRFIKYSVNWLKDERYNDAFTEPSADGRPALHAVGSPPSRQQKETDDLFDRAMQRAQARMQQQEIS